MTIGPLRPAISVSTLAPGGFILDHATSGRLDTGGTLGSGTYILTDVSTRVLDLSVRRGRNYITDQQTPGSAVFTIKNSDYVWPLSAFQLGQLVTVSAYNTSTLVTTSLMHGTLEDVEEVIEPSTGLRAVRLVVADFMKQLEATPVSVGGAGGGGAPPSRTVSDYIANRLTQYPTAVVDTNAGTGVISNTSGTSLSLIQAAELADGGAFFINRTGAPRYISRNNLFALSRYVTPLVVLDETDPAARVPVGAVTRSRNADRAINQVVLTNANGLRVARQDNNSVAEIGLRAREHSTLNDNTAETEIVAEHYAALWSKLEEDILPVTYSAGRSATVAQVVAADLYDYLDLVTFNPAGTGPDITTEVTVDAVSHEWAHERGWLTTLKLCSAIPASAS